MVDCIARDCIDPNISRAGGSVTQVEELIVESWRVTIQEREGPGTQ